MSRQANSCGCVKEDGNGVPCVAHGSANTFGELEATVKALRDLVKAQEKLLVCYRLQTRRGVDAALDEMAEAKTKLGWT